MNKLTDESSSSFIAQCSKSLRNSINWKQKAPSPMIMMNQSENVEDEDDNLSASSYSTSTSLQDSDSEEIPVWVKGEQRFISGITPETSCGDLIEVLLLQEESTPKQNPKEYVITERWKRVEQILENKTKILKIWTTWGEAQSEVKFTLRRIDQSRDYHTFERDKDSGRGSPTGSINSAIVRRRRHRASKSSVAWMTHGQTMHPKSQKSNIERLMKLILEQGEVIQQQLSKLRDRELQINNIEEERHRTRERDYGKNYLLETYLNGLHEAEEKEQTTGNSDSGINTEETTTSPEVGVSPSHHEDEASDVVNDVPKRRIKSKREAELLQEHENLKEFNASKDNEETQTSETTDGDISAQIEMLERMVVLNKHLQREEELMVRLGAKIKRYEADASGLTEIQIKEALNKVNSELTSRSEQIEELENELQSSNDTLKEKSNILIRLCKELDDEDDKTSEADLIVPESGLNLSREYLAENIYNISKNIIKSSSINYPRENVEYIRHTPEHMLTSPIPSTSSQIPNASQFTCGTTSQVQVQVHQNPTPLQHETLINFPPNATLLNIKSSDLLASMTYLEKYNQRNSLIENNVMTATNIKLGPKKFINGACNTNNNNTLMIPTQQIDSNSDTGMSSLGAEDVTQMGTLV